MPLTRELISQVRRLDQYELRRLMILTRGLLVHVDGRPSGAPEELPGVPHHVTYRQESVKCGRETCTTCPHGPYWYAYWKEKGRTRKLYIGAHLPGEPLEPVVPDAAAAAASTVQDEPEEDVRSAD